MGLSDLCSSFINQAKLRDETERNIVEFAEAPWGLGLGATEEVPPLYPVQRFLLKCYYNIPLDDGEKNIIIKDRFNEKVRFHFSEMEYLHFLFEEGRININEVTGNPEDVRSNLLLVIGRRGLKTSSIALLISYEIYKLLRKYNPHQYYNIMAGDEIRFSCIATNKEQATELFSRITGHIERSDYFKRFRNRPTLNYMQLSTEHDVESYGMGGRPSIRVVASPCSGRGLRGHNNMIVVFDEMAYFFEADTSIDRSDRVIYEAVTPSVAKFNSPDGQPHGRIISISSPGTRSGKFFELYQRAFEPDCNDLLMIQAPTWEVDYTLSPKYLRSKFAENPTSYMSEFGAQFSDRISGWIDNEQILRVNIVPGLRTKQLSYERIPHFMGIDIGLKNDGTAIAITHIVRKDTPNGPRDFIELDCADVRYAKDEKKEHFRPEEIAEWIAGYTKRFFIVKGIMDQYYGLAIVPALFENGIKQIEAVHVSRDFSSKVYQNLMSKMLDASLRIPEGEPHVQEGRKTSDLSLVTELLTLQATQHSQYMITVQAPDVKGMHDDLSDAYARSVYLATDYLKQGGLSSVKSNIAKVTGQGVTYKRYLRKARRSSLYTQRPCSAIQGEISKSRQLAMSIARGRR